MQLFGSQLGEPKQCNEGERSVQTSADGKGQRQYCSHRRRYGIIIIIILNTAQLLRLTYCVTPQARIMKKRNAVTGRLDRRNDERQVMRQQLVDLQATFVGIKHATKQLSGKALQKETKHRQDYCRRIRRVDVKGRLVDHATPSHWVPKMPNEISNVECVISNFETLPLTKMVLPRLSVSSSTSSLSRK